MQNCFDSEISKCVCAVDPVCCEAKWDLKCAEVRRFPSMAAAAASLPPPPFGCRSPLPLVPVQEVESTKCGRCPVE